MKPTLTFLMMLAAILFLSFQCKTPTNVVNTEQEPTVKHDPVIICFEFNRKGMRGNIEKECLLEKMTDGNYQATYGEYGKKQSAMCDEKVAQQVLTCLEDGKYMSYKDYYDPGPNVLDGHTWHFKVKFEDGKYKSSGGRIKRPKDFSGIERSIEVIKNTVGFNSEK